jgi:hypothetical protein
MIADIASRYAARMNASEFAVALRSGQLDRRRYVSFLAMMYPMVVGFNRALINSIAKVDHVRHSSFVGALAKQLYEEQAHNALWRAKLDVFGIDHEALYGDLEDYLARFSRAQLDAATADVIAAVTADISAGDAQRFAGAIFPDAILALYHHLWTSATHDSIGYWEHFASQAGIEMVIYKVVTTSVLPGVCGHRELDLGRASTQWWREHGEAADSAGAEPTEEERHLELSRLALNRSEVASSAAPTVIARAEDAMRLFAASFLSQDAATARFPLDRYLK